MAFDAFLMVLSTSFVHASWNALVKAEGDRLALIKLMSKAQMAPLALLSALREALKEQASLSRLASTAAALAGITVLKLGR